MSPWRGWLLAAVLAGTLGGYAWLFLAASAGERPILLLFAAVFVLGIGATHWHYRHRLSARLVTANLALGSIVHLAVAGPRRTRAGSIGLATTGWWWWGIWRAFASRAPWRWPAVSPACRRRPW